VQLRKNWNQFDREIVHAVKTHVFKRVENSTFTGAGESGQDDQLA